MTKLRPSTNIMKNPEVTQVIVDQETIILEPAKQAYYGLNSIGAKIWSRFSHRVTTIEEIARYLQQEFHLDHQQSMQDACQFVEMLITNKLVHIKD